MGGEQFALVAEFPMGVYLGRSVDRSLEEVPSPARLASALLQAAACGPRAVEHDELLTPCREDLAVLEWLEHNPPDGMRLPERTVNSVGPLAWRSRVLEKRGKQGWGFTKPSEPVGSVSLSGSVSFTWSDEPAAPIRDALAALSADVAYLGTAQCPVRLQIGCVEPTHTLQPDADWWEASPGAADLSIPGEGRTRAHIDAYRKDHPRSKKKESKAHAASETDIAPSRPAVADSLARYAPVGVPAEPPGPWARVLLARLDRDVPHRRVAFAAVVHRALIKAIGSASPAVLTGIYDPGVERPPNNAAIQFLTANQAVLAGMDKAPHVLLMLPERTDPADAILIARAWLRLRKLFDGRNGERMATPLPEIRSAMSFWQSPATGTLRLWQTAHPAVCETRPQGRGWTLEDAATLSVGLAHRRQLDVEAGKGTQWYRSVTEAVQTAGVSVLTSPVADNDLGRFVHKVQPGFLIRPYQAVIDLGALAGPRQLSALGQSRHLGGGLLVPHDLEMSGA